MSKKIPHDWLVPHDIAGDGRVTKCDPQCRAYCRWLDDPFDSVGVEPLADDGWKTIEAQRELDQFPSGTREDGDDLFGVLPNAPVPEPITALYGLGQQSARASALNEAIDLITGDRNAQYGPPTQDFQRTADLLTALGYRFADFNNPDGEPVYKPLTASDVAIIMIELKMSRIIQSRGKRDSWVDLAGYAGCGYECTTEERN